MMRWTGVALAFTASLGHAQQCLESEARPPVDRADLRMVKRAGQILNSPAKWNRSDTRECPATAKTFSLYCALEKATDEVSGNFQHRGAAMQEARFVIDDIAPLAASYDHRLMDYNNDPATTFADIRKVFRLLETRIQNRLKEDPGKARADAARLDATCLGVAIRVVGRVREILDSPSKWDRASTQACAPTAATFGLYCAFEKASREVNGDFDGGGPALDEARQLIDESPNHDKYKAHLVDYNNDPTVTFQDLQQLLSRVEDTLKKRLVEMPSDK